jgi:hypothetical protein
MKLTNSLSVFLLWIVCTPLWSQVNPFGNPLIPDMIADASIQEINGIFYCYATTDGYNDGLKTSGPPVVWTSKDFVHWNFSGTYFPSAFGQLYWAPSKAVPANGKFYIYPTINAHIYVAESDRPEGPFRVSKGKDEFFKPFTPSRLLKDSIPSGIDAEIFIDDDGQAYIFWNRRHVAKLTSDMTAITSDIKVIDSPHEVYSEGSIFFKRKGIYYYLYTLGGDEHYQYAYLMSKVSPMGPYEVPQNDIIATTDYEKGIFGPGHGSVFKPENSEQYYFVYLEFGRRSTNRQTYVNRLEFNEDGTIRPVHLNMNGVGALRTVHRNKRLPIAKIEASSSAAPQTILPMKDQRLHRIEYFVPKFVADGQNGSRWMTASTDSDRWIIADLGKPARIGCSEIYFVRPTESHLYTLEGSNDKQNWHTCGGCFDGSLKAPMTDTINRAYRYLRIRIHKGVPGIWEWSLYE